MEITIKIEDARLRLAMKCVAAAGLLGLLLYPLWAHADSPQIKHRFQSGDRIRASDFNDNFDEFKRAVDNNHALIGSLNSLKTSARGDLVTALNELFDSTNTRCGDLNSLQTNARNSLVDAVNELHGRAGSLEGRVAGVEGRRQYMTFSPTTFPDIIAGPNSGANVAIGFRQFDGVRHLATNQGDLNAIHAFADAPTIIKIAGTTLDGNRNINPIPGGGGDLALDVVVHYNNSITDTFVTVATVKLNLPGGASGTQRFTVTVPSLRAAAPADATGLNEITVNLNAGQSTIPAGGLGAIRATAFVPLEIP